MLSSVYHEPVQGHKFKTREWEKNLIKHSSLSHNFKLEANDIASLNFGISFSVRSEAKKLRAPRGRLVGEHKSEKSMIMLN